jgi:uncharacterized membrane protein
MDAMIGVFDNHDLAVEAVQELKESNYPVNHITIMGKASTEVIDKDMHIMPKNPINVASLGTGTAVGTAIGALTGAGIFAIPGLGFLYGAGALIGAIAGFDFGLIGGGIAAVLATIGVKDENARKFHDALEQGKFLVIAHGDKDEVARAKEILRAHNRPPSRR